MDTKALTGVIIIFFLVIIKAFISKVKAAVGNVNENIIENNAKERGDKKSLLLLQLLDNKPESYTYGIDVLITVISVMCGFVYYSMIFDFVNAHALSVGVTHQVLAVLYNILAVMILVIAVTVFGSLLPKKLARKNSEKKAYKNIGFLMFLMKVLRPLTFFLQKVISLCIRILRIDPKELSDNVTEDEIKSMVNEGHEQGVLEADEAKMISNIMEFDEKQVKDIMTHRKNIVAIKSTLSIKDALEFMLSESFSRFPLYTDEIDNVVGLLHIKDVVRAYVDDSDKSLIQIARKPLFVPETQNIDVLFNDMKQKKTHMAIAIDEYGQTAGIVAFEDALEEIVGNIFDEYDEEEKVIVKQANGSYIMKGMTMLEDVEKALNIKIKKDEYDTLNGLLISGIQRIPGDGEKWTVNIKGYIFEILDVKNNMIKFVRVRKAKTGE